MPPSSNKEQNISRGEKVPIPKEDALKDIVTVTVTGYLKNNLNKQNNPQSAHFQLGLAKSIESGISIKNPNSKDAKVQAFLKWINRNEEIVQRKPVIRDTHEQGDATNLRFLIDTIAEDFAIDISSRVVLEQLAQAVYDSEIAVLKKRGQGGDLESQGIDSWENLPPKQKDKYRENLIQKRAEQVESIKRWVRYVSSSENPFPAWYKYFVILSLRSMGVEQYELGTYTYGGRDKTTLFRFPTLNQAVLAKVYDRMLDAFSVENRLQPIPSKYEIQEAVRRNIDEGEQLFLKKYAKEANFTQLYAYELSKYKEAALESRRSREGIWVKYNQQKEGSRELKDEARRLSNSLLNKGTAWCTEQMSFSENQLKGGDFYVYYTREDFDKESHTTALEDMTEEEKCKVCTMPRIAIKMQDGVINELRGIVGGDEQDLEEDMLDIAEAKIQGSKDEAPLGGFEAYKEKVKDMKKLTFVYKSYERGATLTQDDLLFLYEVNGSIEGFGHSKDPRIEEIKKKRNRQEDVLTMCNCGRQQIAGTFKELTASTQVFCEDNGGSISIVDFREERHKGKLEKLLELKKKLEEVGSPATPDMSFEGGFIGLEITKHLADTLSTWNGIQKAYQGADNGSLSYVWDGLEGIPYTPLHVANLDVLVLNHKRTTPQERDALVENMDKIGYRPLTFLELVALGIIKPEYNKRDEVLNTYRKYSLVGEMLAPCLFWDGGGRLLGAIRSVVDWNVRIRFLFVRK